MIREGSGEPLVLLHGVTCSENVWSEVIPYLTPHYDVIALTALGHKGGQPAKSITTFEDIVNDTEASLDKLGIKRAHFAGNSMGGWSALELARRERAISVCALSPAGCWDVASENQLHALRTLKAVTKITKKTRWALPLVAKNRYVRRFAMRENAVKGDRLTAEQLISMADDLLGCPARFDLLNTHEFLAPMKTLPCPIMLAWAERDRIFPVNVNGAKARSLIPNAEWRMLPKVGHVPMIDNPKLVADTILASTGL